ncbi:MAG: twitching motility protein PilT, partial [Pirellulaceae bacterium]|nr:twitching motility protein PilT [Pirellulaceae bacterium]
MASSKAKTTEVPDAPVDESSGDALADAIRKRLLNIHQDLEIDKLFKALVKLEGSDLHLKVGRPPLVRTKGELRPLNRPD